MFTRRSKIILIVGFVLTLAALACGPSLPGLGSIPGDDTVDTPSDGGDDVSEGEDVSGSGDVAGGEDDVPLNYAGIDLSELSSYRARFTMSFEGTDDTGAAVNVTYALDETFQADPPASYYRWNLEGVNDPSGAGSVETYRIGDVTYMLTSAAGSEPQCVAFSEPGTAPEPSPVFSPDTYLSGSDLSGAKRIRPDEMVNGVMTRHYRVTEADVTLSGLSNYTMDVWVSVDGNYMVRQTMAADGALLATGGGNGHVEWTYELLEINNPVQIEPPDSCEQPGGADFPKMPDASNVGAFGSILSYTSASTVADVVAFYRAELAAQGWTETSATELEGLATLEFTRGDEKVTITITTSGGETNVLIAFE